MKAGETSLQKLMQGALQFVVPIYQRTYSWSFKQCDQLWKDIIQITMKKDDKVHFIGSVVYIDLGAPLGRPQQLLLIDGQQRLTTLSLLLCALARHIDKNGFGDRINSNKIKNYFLFNNDENGIDRYKMILTEQDKDTFIHILDGTEETMLNPSEQMLINFAHFQEIIEKSGETIEAVYEGINRLVLVAVALDKTQDNPQLIFESMNSTGKDLSQADLIRNYILMGQPPHEQDKLYTTYWWPMEQGFGQHGYTEYFDWFMRDYLTCKNDGRICKIKEVYDAFKAYHRSGITNEQLPIDVFTYAQYYIRIHLCKDKDVQLNALWIEMKGLDVNVGYPFALIKTAKLYQNHLFDSRVEGIQKSTTMFYIRYCIYFVLSRHVESVVRIERLKGR